MTFISNKNLKKLQKKCNLPQEFLEAISGLFEKLIEFGYISKYNINSLSKKLYNNIDVVILGNNKKYDYKSGYYDAAKKELYIKDLSNTQSVYLRLIYILTTKEIDENVFTVGYSKTAVSKKNYKIIHSNFGINRAIVSNLVCRIMYTLPTTLSIVPTYRTYENDFLGVKVEADNDIYFLEGKLLRQLCFTLNINEEQLYVNLFKSSPSKHVSKLLNGIDTQKIFEKLDHVSRTYSNYNKLCYFNKMLTDNYIEIKKHCIAKDEILNEYLNTEKNLQMIILKTLNKLTPENVDDNEDFTLDLSLTEKINELEDIILSDVAYIQEILINTLIERKKYYKSKRYVINLKKLEDMLVLNSKKINTEIYETISHSIIHANERTCTNIIEKIKYSLANYILSDERYAKVYSDTFFKKLLLEKNMDAEAFVIISNGLFSEIAHISNLDNDMQSLINNTTFLKLKNLRHILNISNENTENIENIFSKLKDTFKNFKKITLEDVFICKYQDLTFLLVVESNKTSTIKVDENLNFTFIEQSEDYNILGQTRKNLPTIYNKQTGIEKIVAVLLSIFKID